MEIPLKKILEFLEQMAPFRTALDWDNSGIQVGCIDTHISGIMLSLDISPKIIKEAVKMSANLIITHHPLIFRPLKSIDFSTPTGEMIRELILNDIVAISMHTNLDRSFIGTGRILADIIGLGNVERYTKDPEDEMNMIFTGVFSPPLSGNKILSLLKECLACNTIFTIGDVSTTSSVAIVPGSGGSLIRKMRKKFDLVITGELSYHDALEAKLRGLKIAVLGHHTSEKPVMFHLGEMLRHQFPTLPIYVSRFDGEPYNTV